MNTSAPQVRRHRPPHSVCTPRRGAARGLFGRFDLWRGAPGLGLLALSGLLSLGAALPSWAAAPTQAAPAGGTSATATPAAATSPAGTPVSACPASLNHTLARLQDEVPQSLCQYAGKVVLAVNTASYCGFTQQYKGLEALHQKYQAQGLVVLGFPSNDFAQEKGSNKDIADFCENTFGVKFPMFAASSVRGAQANPFFRQLVAQGASAPKWNFYKYLLGRDGQLIASYSSMTSPDSRELIAAIEKGLKASRP